MKKDELLYAYLSDSSRYADLINGIGCRGAVEVHPEDITEADTRVMPDRAQAKGRGRAKGRDMLKKIAFGMNFAVIGVEDQETIDYSMVLRNLGYDAGYYERQAAVIRKEVRSGGGKLSAGEYMYGFRKTDRLHPVGTVILYFGEKPWDGPRTLKDMLDLSGIPDGVAGLISDYRINVVDVMRLTDTKIFHTDIRQVFDCIRYSKDKEKFRELVGNDLYYRSMEEDAYDVAASYTNAKELIDMKDNYRKDGKINMCQALAEWAEEEKNEGMRIQAEKDAAIMAEKDLILRKKDVMLQNKDVMLSEKDKKIEELLRIVNGRRK